MNDIAFKPFNPWIGSKYGQNSRFGRKVLVLGESHYGDRPRPEFTIDVVRRYGQEQRARFFTIAAKLLLGMGAGAWLSDQERAEVWEHVSFMNYVPGLVGGSSRERPTEEMWRAGEKPFLSAVEELKPDIIVVLGQELSHWLPELPPHITVFAGKHPSGRGFNYAEWNPQFTKTLQEARA